MTTTREMLEQGIVKPLRQQSKRVSLLEASVNTVIGFALASFCTWIIVKIYGLQMTFQQNFILVGWMTLVSVIRGYVLRRMFNSEFWRRFAWGRPRIYPSGTIR
jgi:Flp pilus assembly protein TadB